MTPRCDAECAAFAEVVMVKKPRPSVIGGTVVRRHGSLSSNTRRSIKTSGAECRYSASARYAFTVNRLYHDCWSTAHRKTSAWKPPASAVGRKRGIITRFLIYCEAWNVRPPTAPAATRTAPSAVTWRGHSVLPGSSITEHANGCILRTWRAHQLRADVRCLDRPEAERGLRMDERDIVGADATGAAPS